jgi:hypothetical protein
VETRVGTGDIGNECVQKKNSLNMKADVYAVINVMNYLRMDLFSAIIVIVINRIDNIIRPIVLLIVIQYI